MTGTEIMPNASSFFNPLLMLMMNDIHSPTYRSITSVNPPLLPWHAQTSIEWKTYMFKMDRLVTCMIAAFQLKRAVALPVKHSGVCRISVTNLLSSSGFASCTGYWSHLPESNFAYTATTTRLRLCQHEIVSSLTNLIETHGNSI